MHWSCPILSTALLSGHLLPKDMQKLQVAQNKAAQLILSCSIQTSTKQMHSSLSWPTLCKKLSLNVSKNGHCSDRPAYFAERLVGFLHGQCANPTNLRFKVHLKLILAPANYYLLYQELCLFVCL